MTAPFHDMIPNYTKNSNKPLDWNEDLESQFIKLQ